MVDAAQTLELFRFADPGQSIAVEVECGEPLMSGKEGRFAAFIVVKSDFVHGRVGLVVSAGDLDDWERCLDALQAEGRAEWPTGGRTAWLEVVPEDPLMVTVHDAPSTQIAVRMPIDDTSDWMEENRLRLERIRQAVEL
ncbi:DUF5959 family protein [Nocardiopsis dassonvillei]|uniref:DUF5959 family protein n=1 Tax=Nocardiopsis dassonvillei TaxID=2014 RepID=UPI00366C82CD